ncbi:hypothetical protein Tco_0902711 [Tanacetum coccineum]
MAKQVIPTSQLVPRFHTIGRCNNYAMLQSIPCSPECKIVGKILLDHPLSYALTATADVPVVYLQQFWRTVSKVHVETPENPFVTPVNIETIEAFMNRVGYQGVIEKSERFLHKESSSTMANNDFMNNVRQTKEAIQYPRFIKLILADLMKKFLEIPQRIKEDYHSIKDDIPLVSVYTTGDVRVRGMLILDAFLTKEIHTTNEFKKYETVFMNVDVPMNQLQPIERERERERERDAIAEATLLSLALHKTTLAAEAQENVAKVQEKLDKDEIEKMVEGEEYEESYASAFTDSVFNDDVDDFEIEKKKKDEEVEKEKEDEEIEIEKEKDIADNGTGSTEIRKVQKQTPIPSPTRSPRSVSSDKITTRSNLFSYQNKFVTQDFFMSKIHEVLDHCNKVVPDTTFAKTKEMITQEMPRLVNLAVNKDREVDPINAKEMIAKEFATHRPKMIEARLSRSGSYIGSFSALQISLEDLDSGS